MGDNAKHCMDDDRRADPRAEDRALERREDAALVERARSDDPDAFGQLYDRWFVRVNDLAYRVTNDSAAAGDVAQDAFLAAWQKLDTLQDPEAFGGWLLRITRNAALDRRRKDERARPHDAEAMAVIEAAGPSPANAPAGFRVEDRTTAAEDPTRAAEDGELAALLWESAAALGERDAEVLDLMLRHGMAPAEIGEVVGLNRNAANQAVHRARNRLKAAVEARVLWRSGEPVCAGLAGALETAKISRFGPEAMRVTTRHAERCEECQARRQTKLEPSRMFAAVPMVVASMFLKDKVAHALSESGVPMQGSSSLGGDTSPPDGPKPRGRRVLRRVLTGVGVLVGALVILGLLAETVHEVTDTETTARRSSVTTTTGAGADDPTTTTVPLDVSTTLGTTVTTTAVFVPPPPTAPPTVPESGTAQISVRPAQISRTGGPFITITWGSTGGTASVNGPGVASSAASGQVAVCPGRAAGSTCVPTAPSYTWTIVVRGTAGQVLAQSSATVTVI
jgi:RNA polymerase sigma factor (sigma-70 family)